MNSVTSSTVNDPDDFAGRIEHRRVDRAPVFLLESAALRLRPADVVFLYRHRVRPALAQRAFQRCAQVRHARCRRIVRIVGEDVEDTAPQDLLAPCHRCVEVGVARRDDAEIWFQD
jgi:hypothetical protein